MENFSLLNLIRALSGQSEQDSTEDSQVKTSGGTKPQQKEQPQDGTQGQPNIFASVIERHDAISYRIKNRRNKK